MYRDFKMENIVQLQPGSYMIIDLEAVAQAGADLPPGFGLRTWDHDTLTNGRYTTSSDMHMIGSLTDKLLRVIKPLLRPETLWTSSERRSCQPRTRCSMPGFLELLSGFVQFTKSMVHTHIVFRWHSWPDATSKKIDGPRHFHSWTTHTLLWQ